MKIETEFTGLPLSKLESLLNNGWKVNGVHIQSVQMDGTLKHGAVTTGGMVLWWHPEQKRVIAPSVRSVAQQTLDALEKFGRGESSGISMTVLVHNLREALAPNSVEFDGIKTEPAQQDLAGYECYAAIREGGRNACEDEYFAPRPAHDHEVSRTLFRHGFDRGYDRASAQQDPDALHLAAMDLARKQADRIADLEAEVARFRTDAMNEKAARQALEQQLAARVPLTDEQIWEFWWSRQEVADGEDDSMEAQFIAAVRAIEAAHGITKGTA